MNEVRLKEQEARLTTSSSRSSSRSRRGRGAARSELPRKASAPRRLQAEIARLTKAISALGAVNLAALEELSTSQERKTYLDAQSRT